MPKECQHGAKIDAQTHQKPMPKLVTNKIIKVIKINVFLNGKIILIHCKNNGFEGFAGCARERKKVSNKLQQ